MRTRSSVPSPPVPFPQPPACAVGPAALWEATLRRAVRGLIKSARGRAAGRKKRRKGRVNKPLQANHHLWLNNGTWFMTCTVYPSRCTKERLRYSLETHSVVLARRRRDAVFAALQSQGLLSTHGHARASLGAAASR